MVLDEVVTLVVRQGGVVFLAEERPRRRDLQTQHELRTTTGVDGVVDRRTTQLEVQGEVMRRSVSDQQVRPVFHPEEGVPQLDVEVEVVVRPFETLTITDSQTELTDELILVGFGFRQLLVVVGVAGVVIVVRVCVIEVLVRFLVTAGPTGLVVEEEAGTQLIRTLTTEPRLQERERDGGGVDTVGTQVDSKSLTFALRYYMPVRLLVKEVLDREVGEFETDSTGDTGSTPTERELDLVAGFGLQVIGNIHRSVFGIRLDVRHKFLLVEVTHLRQLTERTHDIRLRVELSGFGV